MTTKGWSREQVRADGLLGELYVPDGGERAEAPALVIMPSSAGVCDIRERFYAGYFAERGCRCLIADAFARRGLHQCMTDQTLLGDRDMLEDARAAFRWLTERGNTRIGILGVSKGGQAALNAAMSPMPGLDVPGTPDVGAFAVHICLAPSCAVQLRHPRTTGAPILMLLGGRDDYTGTAPALRYAARITTSPVETVVFPEARHAWELCGEPQFYPQAECYADRLFSLEDDGSITDDATGETFSTEAFRRRQRSFARYGAHAGGGTGALRRQGCETILAFMRRTGFLPERG